MKFAGRPYHIYWFSGSGNTLLIAVEIKKALHELGCEAKLFPMERIDPGAVDLSAVIGFVVPVAEQGTHKLIWEFLERLPQAEGTPCFLVDTLGLYSGGIVGPIKNIVTRKGYVPLAATEILMPNIFYKRKSDPPKENIMIEKGKTKIRHFCECLVAGRGSWFDIPGYSWVMSLFSRSKRLHSAYRRMFPVAINSDKCIRCGLCARLCPVKHWTLASEKSIPKGGTSCMLCHRCFAFCPADAISIGSEKNIPYHALPAKEFLSYLENEANRRL